MNYIGQWKLYNINELGRVMKIIKYKWVTLGKENYNI